MGAEAAAKLIPTSCTVRESGIVSAPVDQVWAVVKKVDFSWRKDVSECTVNGNENELCTRTVKYGKDGEMTQVKALRGLNSYDHTATWEMLSSEPAVKYSSARYNVSLEPITMSKQTLVIFTTVYSNDATVQQTEDQKYKLRDGIQSLQNTFAKKAE